MFLLGIRMSLFLLGFVCVRDYEGEFGCGRQWATVFDCLWVGWSIQGTLRLRVFVRVWACGLVSVARGELVC